ncbi:hypothetical protein RKE38_18245 [Phycicoccus sp. M110.8]|uniref:hypothetical protein n=1 Tax=Phycicoccus sp. M110.8 TaxID=3075433 RepID=UPI0028FD07E4|nr:hypothetical protein [Phycicoccus sp. M110.8]MDU0315644.1 hypothetical protein [Phycicoccus sp. M110.8]
MDLVRELIPLLSILVTAAAGWLAGRGSWNRLERALALYERMPDSVRPDFEELVRRRARRIRRADAVPVWALVLLVVAFVCYFARDGLQVWAASAVPGYGASTEEYEAAYERVDLLEWIGRIVTGVGVVAVTVGILALVMTLAPLTAKPLRRSWKRISRLIVEGHHVREPIENPPPHEPSQGPADRSRSSGLPRE